MFPLPVKPIATAKSWPSKIDILDSNIPPKQLGEKHLGGIKKNLRHEQNITKFDISVAFAAFWKWDLWHVEFLQLVGIGPGNHSVACFVCCFLLFLMMFLQFWCVASGGAGVDLQTLLERGLGLQPCCQRTKDQRLAKGSEDRNRLDHCSSAGNTFAFFCLIP